MDLTLSVSVRRCLEKEIIKNKLLEVKKLMSIVNKIRDIFVPPEDEEFDDEMDILNSSAPEPKKNTNYDYEDTTVSSKKNKVVNIHATTQLQVVLVKPEHFEDASSIADHLNNKRTVVLNLESASKELARRLVDFLSGVAYANNGQIKRVANSTFIITPYNVDIMGDLLDELENSGVYF